MSSVQIQDNTGAVRKAVRRAAYKNLRHAGASLRLAAQYSIRKRVNPSEPGTPPHTRQGALRNSILFAVEDEHTAVIGPSVAPISDVARAHEHGGQQMPRGVRGKTREKLLASGTNWKLYVGGHGPIGDGDGTAYIKFVSQSQVQKSARYIEQAPPEAFGRTKKARAAAEKRRILGALAGKPATYPKRPFMGPALMKNLDRLPAMWASSVK